MSVRFVSVGKFMVYGFFSAVNSIAIFSERKGGNRLWLTTAGYFIFRTINKISYAPHDVRRRNSAGHGDIERSSDEQDNDGPAEKQAIMVFVHQFLLRS